MKAYKGFNKDMTCRGFQYEVGKEYHEDKAKLCESGFHACKNPLDCFTYYNPANSVYHEVELNDVIDQTFYDSKVCGKLIKIGAKIDILSMVNIAAEYIKSNITDSKTELNIGDWSVVVNAGDQSAATNIGYHSVATNTGNQSASMNTGKWSASINTGDKSIATNTGDWSAVMNTGDWSAATNTGLCSVATNTGEQSAATNTGYQSVVINTGDRSAATNTGNSSVASVEGTGSIAIASGYKSKAKASLGSAICICERGEWNGETYPLLAVKAAIIDGKILKPDTWYMLVDGEFVESE